MSDVFFCKPRVRPREVQGSQLYAPPLLCTGQMELPPPSDGQIQREWRRVLFGLQRPQGLRRSDRRQFVYVAQWIQFQAHARVEAGPIYSEEGRGMFLYSCQCFYKCWFSGQGQFVCVYVSVKLLGLIRISQPSNSRSSSFNRHVYMTLTPSITCLYIKSVRVNPLPVDFNTVNIAPGI